MTILHIHQTNSNEDQHKIRLTLRRAGQPDQEGEANIQFALTGQEQEDLRWYLEDYLQRAEAVEAVTARQVEAVMKSRGEELYTKVLAANGDTQAIWFSIRDDLANLRVEVAAGITEAASIPWELMRDPTMDSPISLRVKAFVRIQSNPNISFIPIPPAEDGRIRLLYIACRPSGDTDVELRAVANRLLQDLGENRARFEIKALRPPTLEHLQTELTDVREAGRPYHIVHFDGHGVYADLSKSRLADWAKALSSIALGGEKSGKHGYLLFEHPSEDKMRPVDGQTLGQLLHDAGSPILVLNACQSAMHEMTERPRTAAAVHDEIRAIGSLAQAVIDQGIPAVLGMRYSVYVVTAAQYIGQLYSSLAKGRSFGQAATEGRKHLHLNPDRWIGLQPRPLQDWFVPVVYEATPTEVLPAGRAAVLGEQRELDPVQTTRALLRYVPEEGFVGRDETILTLDRAYDTNHVVLLHAYAGQGKSSTAVEFARWYSLTGGLGQQPLVLLASFERQTDLDDLLNQIGQLFAPLLETQSIDWSAVNDTAKRRQLVLQILRQIPVLWIWDNVEPVAGFPEGTESQWTTAEQNELRDFLKQIKLDTASKVKILLTSRRDEQGWLGGIPHRIAMRRMRNSDSAKLALKLGAEKGLKPSDVAGWQPLIAYCSGNPLTLRVLVGQAVRMGLRGKQRIEQFVEEIRSGEQRVEDADEKQGRDKSLGASLDYGFRHAFRDHELPIIALLQLFQGTVDVNAFRLMGQGEHALEELQRQTSEQLMTLLNRAKDIGLVTHLQGSWFAIHPALPWFLRQIFSSHYDGQNGRSTSQAATRTWVEVVSSLGEYGHRRFNEGHRSAIDLLELAEANLLHARRLARRNEWWRPVIAAMQGLGTLYEYQGRIAEWAKLVAEIVPDYCSADDEPVSGREALYTLVMGYRVVLARNEHDLAKAAALQERHVEHCREAAAAALALGAEAPLDREQHHQLRTLGVGVFMLGMILKDDSNAACLARFKESLEIDRRIGDKQGQAVDEFNIGHAHKDIPSIRDLDAAEAAYQRSLGLYDPKDGINRGGCIYQIGTVHYERLLDARNRKEPREVLLSHAKTAESYYLQGLQLSPKDALIDLGTMHHQLATLYVQVGRLDDARDHFELAAQIKDKTGNHYSAGTTRFNMALMYAGASQRENQPSEKRGLLIRAQAYAEGALRDFEHYQGRAADDEAKAQTLLDRIRQDLASLPQ